jgi:hypothetical protein
MKSPVIPVIILVFGLALCISPALCATKYIGASPAITAYVGGTNEYSPGEDATITVVLQNGGTNWLAFTNRGTIAPEDVGTTAKLVKVGLDAGTAPVVIKTDPQQIGDLASPDKTTVKFTAKITQDATLGEYQLPLTVSYKYLSGSLVDQPTTTTIENTYTETSQTIPLTIKIKPVVKIDVLNATGNNLVVGTEGTINLTIKNTGYDDGKQATVKLLRNGDSAVIPTDDSVYIGNFPRNGIVSCQYKVAVSNDAQAQSYPVDVAVTYTNAEGDTVTSETETIGVPVAGKLTFSVTSPPATITQGKSGVIAIEYTNLGSVTAYKAQARLSAVEPFSSADQMAYLGDIPPGGKAVAQYAIAASSSAAPGNYTLDTEVRYRDALDNSQISDTFRAPLSVLPRPASDALGTVIAAIVVIGIIAALVYYFLVMRRKQ